MRDQYAGDVSDFIKFAFLRALAGSDRALGIAWYYDPGHDGKPDGRHLEWREEPAWRQLDARLHAGLSTLPERSIAALQNASIWPAGTVFHREEMPTRALRAGWGIQKRDALKRADIVFLDPDNGLGNETSKHATLAEVSHLRRPARAIVFITFPGRNATHNILLERLNDRLRDEAGAESVVTLRTNVSVPTSSGSGYVQRQRWFTVVDPDPELVARASDFADALARVPRVRAALDRAS